MVMTGASMLPAKGATISSARIRFLKNCFNPRPREGGDFYAKTVRKYHREFQSTPPRRGRRTGTSNRL